MVQYRNSSLTKNAVGALEAIQLFIKLLAFIKGITKVRNKHRNQSAKHFTLNNKLRKGIDIILMMLGYKI